MRSTRKPISIVASLVAATALAAPAQAQSPVLPVVGQVVVLDIEARGVGVTKDGDTLTTDLTGDVVLRIVADEADPLSSVRVKVLDLDLTGTTPDGGTVEVAPRALDTEAPGRLVLNKTLPPSITHVLALDFRITITQPQRFSPLVLTTKEPLELFGEVLGFPPSGASYALRQPVELVDGGNHSIATIDAFPVTVDIP